MPTPLRNIRVNNDLWAEAMTKAAARGESLTSVIVKALEDYCDSDE